MKYKAFRKKIAEENLKNERAKQLGLDVSGSHQSVYTMPECRMPSGYKPNRATRRLQKKMYG